MPVLMSHPLSKTAFPLPARRASIRDVAKACGLSIATVSKALNPINEARPVAPETRQRVMEVAAKMGYRPDFAGRSLVSRSIKTIGVYLAPRPWANLGSHYEGPLFRGIETACRADGYDLLVINLAGHESIETCYKSVIERRVMGLILLRVPAQGEWLRDLHQLTQAVVFLDAVDPDPAATAVMFDNVAAVQMAMEHLLSLGHNKIGFLGPCLEHPEVGPALREKAYRDNIAARKLPFHPTWLHNRANCRQQLNETDEYCQAEGYLGIQAILSESKDPPTALIAYNNLVALGAVQYCQEHHIRIPQQLSIVALDDSDLARITHPRLTCVARPLEAMGLCAVELLLEFQGESQHDKAKQKMFAPKMIVRQSTAEPSR